MARLRVARARVLFAVFSLAATSAAAAVIVKHVSFEEAKSNWQYESVSSALRAPLC